MAEPIESGGTGTGTPGGAAQPFRVFATEDEFNAHAAKIRHEAERKARGLASDERAKLDELNAELEQRRQRDLEAAGNYDKAKQALEAAAKERIDKAQAAADKARAALQAHIVEKELRALALAHGAYDPEDVIARLAPRVALDEDFQVRVSDAPGGPVQDGLTMEQAVADLLKSKPHLAKAAGTGTGAGARGGASMGGTFSGSPSQREAQQHVEAAMARVREKPGDGAAAADLMRAKAALKQALAK